MRFSSITYDNNQIALLKLEENNVRLRIQEIIRRANGRSTIGVILLSDSYKELRRGVATHAYTYLTPIHKRRGVNAVEYLSFI